MIGVSKLYCGTVEPSDPLRYGRKSNRLPSHLLQFSADKKPVVVWNMTRACNLACLHCYAAATSTPAPDELDLDEGFDLIKQVAEFGSPVLLFSGGEPLCHPHIFTLIEKAKSHGLRAVLSSNALLLSEETATRLADIGLSYVGISLDGLAETHDRFRRHPGAFDETLRAINRARSAGLKVGLRFTLTRSNIGDLPDIFDLMEREGIPRACFYHLVYSGRGANLSSDSLSHEETRRAVDFIAARTRELHEKGKPKEILTVDNHADGPYLYLKLKREAHPLAEKALQLLRLNGGNSSGNGIGAVSWNGDVHPDQFWREIVLGNVRRNNFADIWVNPNNELLQSLKNKKEHAGGRCRHCFFLDVCGGNLRARGFAATGDFWGEDPACYLTDEEISKNFNMPDDLSELNPSKTGSD